MELLSHLGISAAPNPTIELVLYKSRGYVSMWLVLTACGCYHMVSLGLSIASVFFPDLAEYTKRMAGMMVWKLCIFLSELNRVSIDVEGDSVDPFSAVLIANHQLLADYIVLAALAQKLGNQGEIQWEALPQINFFTWFTLARAPSAKVLLNMARSDENWELAQLQSDRLFHRVRDSNTPEWVVLFPEVNIWTPETSYLQAAQARRYFLPEMHQVLYPRFSSFSNAVWLLKAEKLPTRAQKFSTLYDVLIVHSKPVTLLEFFSCKDPHKVTVHIKKKLLDRIPLRRAKMERWLEKCWVEKDKTVDSITRRSPKLE